MITERDPVCGIDVLREDAIGPRQFRDRSFRFCSYECLADFDKDPDRYLRDEPNRVTGLEIPDREVHS